jgi:hypothetical protein
VPILIDSHLAFDPATVCWPELSVEELARLRSLPFWAEAVATERMTACTVQALAPLETDPLLHAAIALRPRLVPGIAKALARLLP